MLLLLTVVGGYVIIICIKACHSAKLHETDADAWEKWQRHEDDLRRRRQLLFGQILLAASHTIRGWFSRDAPDEDIAPASHKEVS